MSALKCSGALLVNLGLEILWTLHFILHTVGFPEISKLFSSGGGRCKSGVIDFTNMKVNLKSCLFVSPLVEQIFRLLLCFHQYIFLS